MTQDNEHLQVKMNGLKGKLCDSMGHNTASTARFFCFCFVSLLIWFGVFLLNLVFFWGKGLQERVTRDRGMGGIGIRDVKSTKKQ